MGARMASISILDAASIAASRAGPFLKPIGISDKGMPWKAAQQVDGAGAGEWQTCLSLLWKECACSCLHTQ
jgi:hypothetical protein